MLVSELAFLTGKRLEGESEPKGQELSFEKGEPKLNEGSVFQIKAIILFISLTLPSLQLLFIQPPSNNHLVKGLSLLLSSNCGLFQVDSSDSPALKDSSE